MITISQRLSWCLLNCEFLTAELLDEMPGSHLLDLPQWVLVTLHSAHVGTF